MEIKEFTPHTDFIPLAMPEKLNIENEYEEEQLEEKESNPRLSLEDDADIEFFNAPREVDNYDLYQRNKRSDS